jgi:hypothetical protein
MGENGMNVKHTPVRPVRVALDQANTSGWNETDVVQMIS